MMQRHAGFTIIELLAVVSILGILTAFAVVAVDPAARRADAGAAQVRQTLQLAQRTAIQRQFDMIVSFDTAAHRLRLSEDRNNDGQPDSDDRLRWIPLEEGLRFSSPPAAIPALPGTAVGGARLRERGAPSLPSVTFRKDGAASSDLVVYVASDRRGRRDWRALALTPSTGRVTTWRLSGSTWTPR